MRKFSKFLFGSALTLSALSACSQVINPNPPAQAGAGLSQAGSTLSVIYGTTANTSKEGNAVTAVPQGGTGLSSIPSHSLLIGNGAATPTQLAPGTSGYALISNGASADPSYQVLPSALVSSVFGQTGAVPNLSGAVTTSGSSATTFGAGGTSGQVVTSNGASPANFADPSAWHLSGAVTSSGSGATTFGAGGTSGQVVTSNGASPATFQNPAAWNLSGAITTSGSGTTSFGAGGTVGQVLTSNGPSSAAWQNNESYAMVTVAPVVSTANSSTISFNVKRAFLRSNPGGMAMQSPGNYVLNLASSGAGGMDSGSAPINGFVAVYLIKNLTGGSNTLGVNVSSDSFVPDVYSNGFMPSGYVYSGLIAVLPTNSSGTFPLFMLSGNAVTIPITQDKSGTTSVALTSYNTTLAPPSATGIFIESQYSSTATASGSIIVSPYSSTIGERITPAAVNTLSYNDFYMPTLGNLIYYTATASGTVSWAIDILGYTF